MRFLATVFLLCVSPLFDCSIYVYDSEDGASVQAYDCVFHQSTPYCQRPSQPIALQRANEPPLCYANGTSHSFRALRENGTSVHTVLHVWRSSLEKADQYARYLRQQIDAKESVTQLCQCVNPQSFGMNCEYLLPLGTSLTDVIKAKFSITSGKLMYVGEIVCYTTLKCDFGLLCLDWRDICDGLQQCMSGLDEENCDKLEFNECEDNEYRCMNGMCIPDEYFLDGEYDCMDMSDEKEPFDDTRCPYQPTSMECDDRVCPPNRWSCGDGQCIRNRSLTGSVESGFTPCFNRRDQFFWCDHVDKENLLTQENGRCSDTAPGIPSSIKNYCVHLLYCTLLFWNNRNCPCLNKKKECVELYQRSCLLGLLRYPDGGLLAPYDYRYYNVTNKLSLLYHLTLYVMNGTIKCRGYLTNFTYRASYGLLNEPTIYKESFLCNLPSKRANFSNEGYHRYCHNDSQTFNNRSYQWIDVCNTSAHCMSAYRINDGFINCGRREDEGRGHEIVSRSCSRIQQHRFRCSVSQASCLPASALSDLLEQCTDTRHELSKSIQMGVSRARCNSQLKADCPLLRQLVEASWNHSLHNFTSLQRTNLKRLPFRSYCDTFYDSGLAQDENITLCQSSWVCLPGEWQCYTGHCIDMEWVLDGEWDCVDGSDEETMFAVGFNRSHSTRNWLSDPAFISDFKEKYGYSKLSQMCNAVMPYGSSATELPHSSNCGELCAGSPSTVDSPTRCATEYDKEYGFAYCLRTLIALACEFECSSKNVSTIGSFTFRKRCSTSQSHLDSLYNLANSNQELSKEDVTCWNGTIMKRSRCDGKYNCPNREDEFLCGQEKFREAHYRLEKQDKSRKKQKKVKLPRFPAHAGTSQQENRSVTANVTKSTSSAKVDSLSSNLSSLFNWCNRGLPIWTHNGSFVCFCPPQYHGNQCHLHSDRITFITHINYTHSDYTASTDPNIVHKFLVLLLHDDQVISMEEFHVRPATDILNYRKKAIYLQYSHSPDDMKKKQERYFNRSNVISEQPFSVRIEAYEMKPNLRPRRFAVWRYPIYFDYLPVYRLATVLRFFPPREVNPCQRSPCGHNEDCYRVQNQGSQHLCLCKNGHSGPNCSVRHPMCSGTYCLSDAVCHPGYRGLINSNEWPYCICPYGHIGRRCELSVGKCSGNPCQNGGICTQRSKPSEFDCKCTEAYHGKLCELTKPSISLQLKYNASIAYEPVVAQYLKIDLVTLALQVVGQVVYRNVPDSLNYFYERTTTPEIVLIRLHLTNGTEIYLLSLQMDDISIPNNTSMSEYNRCKPVRSLFKNNEGTFIDLLDDTTPFLPLQNHRSSSIIRSAGHTTNCYASLMTSISASARRTIRVLNASTTMTRVTNAIDVKPTVDVSKETRTTTISSASVPLATKVADVSTISNPSPSSSISSSSLTCSPRILAFAMSRTTRSSSPHCFSFSSAFSAISAVSSPCDDLGVFATAPATISTP